MSARAGSNGVTPIPLSNREGAAIGGNRINGDDNVITQQIIQQQSPRSIANKNDNNDHNDGGDNSGHLPTDVKHPVYRFAKQASTVCSFSYPCYRIKNEFVCIMASREIKHAHN